MATSITDRTPATLNLTDPWSMIPQKEAKLIRHHVKEYAKRLKHLNAMTLPDIKSFKQLEAAYEARQEVEKWVGEVRCDLDYYLTNVCDIIFEDEEDYTTLAVLLAATVD